MAGLMVFVGGHSERRPVGNNHKHVPFTTKQDYNTPLMIRESQDAF